MIIEDSGGAAVAQLRYRPGWLLCAASLLLICGVNLVIHGVTALHDPSFFGSQAIYHNLTFWGWFFIAWGAAEVVVGFLVSRGRREAMMAGTALAGVAMLAWFCMIFAARPAVRVHRHRHQRADHLGARSSRRLRAGRVTLRTACIHPLGTTASGAPAGHIE